MKQCGRQLSFLCFWFCFPRPPPSFSSGNNMMESDQTGRRQDKAPHFNSIERRAVPTKPEKSICDFQPPVPASPPTGRDWAGLSLFSFLPLARLPHDHTPNHHHHCAANDARIAIDQAAMRGNKRNYHQALGGNATSPRITRQSAKRARTDASKFGFGSSFLVPDFLHASCSVRE